MPSPTDFVPTLTLLRRDHWRCLRLRRLALLRVVAASFLGHPAFFLQFTHHAIEVIGLDLQLLGDLGSRDSWVLFNDLDCLISPFAALATPALDR